MIPTICPAEIAQQPEKTDFKKLWNSKEWKTKRTDYLKGQVCQHCGTSENLVVCHDDYNLYNDLEAYLDFIYSAKALCRSCNKAEMKGLVYCCTDEKGKNHYRPKDADYCRNCEPEELREKREQKQASGLYFRRQVMNRDNARKRAFYQRVKVKTA